MSVPDVSGKAIANLEIESLRHVAPTFHGDTIYGETTVLDKTESKSKDDRGIVHVETIGYKQDGTVVCIFRRKVMVPKRSYGEARGGEQPGRPEPSRALSRGRGAGDAGQAGSDAPAAQGLQQHGRARQPVEGGGVGEQRRRRRRRPATGLCAGPVSVQARSTTSKTTPPAGDPHRARPARPARTSRPVSSSTSRTTACSA